MGKFLITGRSGSGKSTICALLNERGFNSFDGDKVSGLSRWESIETGEPVSVDPTGFVNYENVAWNWDHTALKELLHEHDNIFLCGSSSNQLNFHDLFDKVFVLVVNPEIQRERILNRLDNDYGKNPRLLEQILSDQAQFCELAVEAGATAVNANDSPENVIRQIVELSNDNSRLAQQFIRNTS